MLLERRETSGARRPNRGVAGLGIAVAAMALAAFAFVPGAGATHGEGNPDCPTDLRLTTLRGAGSPVLVNWTHADGSDATNVYRWIGDGPEELIATVPSDEPDFFADEDTERGEEHTYEVRAVFGDHESDNCPQESTFIRQFSGAPTRVCPDEIDLTAIANQDGSVTLHAEDLDRMADLERRVASEVEWTFVAEMNWDATTHTDHGTEPQTTYEYRLIVHEDECDRAMVTAIPYFGSIAVAGLAALGAAGVYLVSRRRL